MLLSPTPIFPSPFSFPCPLGLLHVCVSLPQLSSVVIFQGRDHLNLSACLCYLVHGLAHRSGQDADFRLDRLWLEVGTRADGSEPACPGSGALASIEQVVDRTVSGLSVPTVLLLSRARGLGLFPLAPSSRGKKRVSSWWQALGDRFWVRRMELKTVSLPFGMGSPVLGGSQG